MEYEKLENVAVTSGGIITTTMERDREYVLETKVDRYGLNDFKHKIYKCETVRQDEVGRVNYMKFVPAK